MLLLKEVIRILSEEGKLPPTYHAHTLQGKYKDLWECHIQPDWLLVWEQNDKEFILYFLSTGTHRDLCKTLPHPLSFLFLSTIGSPAVNIFDF